MKLEIKNLSKTYIKGNNKSLDNLSTEFTSGVYGILGPNGAGKSTLMNIIADNLKADSGEILYNGQNILKLGKDFRNILGYMPQQQGIYKSFTARRFLWYMAALKGIPKNKAKERIDVVLKLVNLQDQCDKKLVAFSGGMKQRILIAQALLNDPEILLLDEIDAIVESMQGKVFEAKIKEKELDKIKEKYNISNIIKTHDGLLARIVAEEKPNELNINEVKSTLEDTYLYYFN